MPRNLLIMHGAKEGEAGFRRARKETRRIVRRSIRAGALIYKVGMKRRAPRERGKLAKSIRIKQRSRSGETTARIGPSVAYGHLVEFGHILVWVQPQTRRAYVVGHVGAQPFVRPTFDADMHLVVRAYRERFERELAGEFKKAGARRR